MKTKLLILTSYITGHGHKSITTALEEEMALREDLEFNSVESFELAGHFGIKIGGLYAPITKNATDVWKMLWGISIHRAQHVNKIVERLIRRKFLRLVLHYQPDIILSVHPIFNGSVLNILAENKLTIPFVTLYADLVSISPVWIDARAALTISPTREGKICALKGGVREETIRVINLPVRKKIINAASRITSEAAESIRDKSNLNFLVMSGGEGSGNLVGIVEELLKNPDFTVSVVAGRNAKLKEALENAFKDAGDKVKVYGFVHDMDELIIQHDVAVVRGSPNVLMECINCGVPVIITGTLPGQEEGNIDFVLNNDLGVLCDNVNKLAKTLEDLQKNNNERLFKIKKAQLDFRDLDAAKKITEAILAVKPGK